MIHQRADRFIPVTPAALVEKLGRDERLTVEQLALLPDISRRMGQHIHGQYQLLWHRLKDLYEPFDPDKDTISRQYKKQRNQTRQEDFLSLFELLMERANFDKVEDGEVERQLSNKETRSGISVKVNQADYECLLVWVRGPYTGGASDWLETAQTLWNRWRDSRAGREQPLIYQRCLTVCKTRDGHLHLKLFKEVDIHQLEQLLPNVEVQLAGLDRTILAGTVVVGAASTAYRMSEHYVHDVASTLVVISATAGLIGYRLWSGMRNNRNKYLAEHNEMLYFHNISSNRSTLAVLIDRAVDEEVMEALLAYHFLVTSKKPLSREGVKVKVEEWLLRYIRVEINFDVDDALEKLDRFGLLIHDDHLGKDPYGRTMFAVAPMPKAKELMANNSRSSLPDAVAKRLDT